MQQQQQGSQLVVNPRRNLEKTFNQQENLIQNEKKGESEIQNLQELLRRLSEPYYKLSWYECKEAVKSFEMLPKKQLKSGWVQICMGRCFMEMSKYEQAEECFKEALKIEPYRLEGVEYYSVCLWHLKKQVELTYLAYNSLEKSIFAQESWIAVGNCFSLSKEHENSIIFFNRAIQLNSNNPYTHTLSGHEYVYNEDYVKARKCFEAALQIDNRHYNAWWGLGNIDFKQEKYNDSITKFKKAIEINKNCPVLYSYLGMSYSSLKNYNEALIQFEISQKLDENNVLNRFQKVNVLVNTKNYDLALQELQKLSLEMPKEAPIPILMGKVYKIQGKFAQASQCFNKAIDLDSKDSQKIKALIESLNQNDQNDDNDL